MNSQKENIHHVITESSIQREIRRSNKVFYNLFIYNIVKI